MIHQLAQCCGMVSSESCPFNINQGEKQGAILSPLIYSLFINRHLVALEQSGLGVKIGSVYCTQMTLPSMHPLLKNCRLWWTLCHEREIPHQPQVFGSNCLPTTTWTIKGQKVKAVKEHLHLGILRSTAPSTSSRTSHHINLGQSSFFALNQARTKFRYLHPIMWWSEDIVSFSSY